MNPIERRLQKIEAAVGAGVIAPDQRDLKLVPVFQTLMGDRYNLEAVPLGVSRGEVVAWIMDTVKGTGFKPVRLPAG